MTKSISVHLESKYEQLLSLLRSYERVTLAFSGGTDSTFLAAALHDALPTSAFALVTVSTPYVADWEVEEAKNFAKHLNAAHYILSLDIPDIIKNNPQDRCYLCKKEIFQALLDKACQLDLPTVIDGTNHDDSFEHRPGIRALSELDIKSPLKELNFSKQDIRTLSKKLGLNTWDKPPYACLLTRIPYHTKIDLSVLTFIEKSETFLMSLGIRAVRVRVHGDLARIEVAQENRKLFFDTDLQDKIAGQLKAYGCKYVTLDLEGYRTGSFDTKRT